MGRTGRWVGQTIDGRVSAVGVAVCNREPVTWTVRFQLDCNDQLQVQIRHCLVNGLACCLSMQGDRRYHFWQHVVDPGSLHGTYGFGSTSNRAIGSIHYDCGCVFEFDGKLRRMEANPHWPAPAAVASYFQSYGAFCLSFAFFPDVAVSLFDRVLTPSSIHSQRESLGPRSRRRVRIDSLAGLALDFRLQPLRTYLNAHGESQSDRTANFCYQRTATSWQFLQAHLQLAGEQVQVRLLQAMSKVLLPGPCPPAATCSMLQLHGARS